MARPTKLNPETQKRIIDALRAGNTRRAAQAYGGIDDNTFYRWIEKDAGFRDALTRAEAECEVENVVVLKKAGTGYEATRTRTKRWQEKVGDKFVTMEETVTTSGREFDWRASLEWLKRRRKEDWSERTEQTGANGGPVEVLLTRVPTPIRPDASD